MMEVINPQTEVPAPTAPIVRAGTGEKVKKRKPRSRKPKISSGGGDEEVGPERIITKDNKKYKLVGFAADLTGRKTVDEICQIGAYTVEQNKPKVFSQYIMTHRNFTNNNSRIHGLRITLSNFGSYRLLKDVRTNQVLQTKSIYATLNDFMNWLKTVKGDYDGIILAHYGYVDNVMSYLVDALQKFKMTDEFFGLVCGSFNCKTAAADMVELKDRSLSMRSVLRRVCNLDEDQIRSRILDKARSRSRLTYNVFEKISKLKDMTDSDIMDICLSKEKEIEYLEQQRILSGKLRSLRPIFESQLGSGYKERSRAVFLRRHLVETALDYETIEAAYKTGSKDAIEKLVSQTSAKEKNFEDLVNQIVSHFQNGKGGLDINSNEKGQGERRKNSTSDEDDDEDDEEFEEARSDENRSPSS